MGRDSGFPAQVGLHGGKHQSAQGDHLQQEEQIAFELLQRRVHPLVLDDAPPQGQ